MIGGRHDVQVVLGGENDPKAVAEVEATMVVNDMLELADEFELAFPWTKELWELSKPDTEAEVYIDGSRVLTGYIEDRVRTAGRSSGSSITISGRDRGGRLIDESAPLVTFADLGIADLAEKLVAPWFETVSLSNARNRALIRGRGRRLAGVSSEPPILAGKNVQRKVEPGESRAQVLTHLLEEAGYLGWSSADGREFIIGEPNYSQAPQWHFFFGAAGSARGAEINVEELEFTESVGDRYSIIEACGSSRGDASNYGRNVLRYRGVYRDSTLTPDGVGGTFRHRKRLLVSDQDVRSAKMAQERAEREAAVRNASGIKLELTVGGYGQQLLGAPSSAAPAIYCFDTVARWEDEEAEIDGDFYITKVEFTEDRSGGQQTKLSLVPVGTELRIR